MSSTAKTGRFTTRLLGGRALRLQPDGRLVSLLRDGYESAFDEIFRRYGAALRSYAASIVTVQRADDVTQDAFTKAYVALRGTDKEIQLRPWLYRIVRNTALTSIRDEPNPGAQLDDAYAAGLRPEELAEQREQIKRLLAGLRELPEPQRAAIVMRELEGLSHEQIAASLGLSGGAVRQSIYRARRALREGLGLLLPLPVLRLLLSDGFAQGASATAAGGGAGIAVKTGVAALIAAGTVATGVVLRADFKATPDAEATPAKTAKADSVARRIDSGGSSHSGSGHTGGKGSDDRGTDHHGRHGSDDGTSGHGGSHESGDHHSGSGSREGSGSDDFTSGSGESGSSDSGSSGSGSGDSGPGGTSGSDSSGSGSGSGETTTTTNLDDLLH